MHYRRSVQRERILGFLRETSLHPTADWIYEKLKKEIPGLSLATVYRNLKVLSDQGLIQKLPFGSSHERYDALMTSHGHLICEMCGKIEDFVMTKNINIDEQVGKKHVFKVVRYRVDFFGVCQTCQQKT